MGNNAKMDIEQRVDALNITMETPDYKKEIIWQPRGESFDMKIVETFKNEETYLNHIKGE